ncbi:hypothetical protein GC1_10355 [Leisingera sp. ANG1]|nr:hypothetical protein RA21_13505 [Leisingera sp. ANG-DT]KIC24793.1 hypothetical protein RA23_09640 [Leisingera sp. ANG-S3]KIC55351.1 hypothetical protein RA22_00970 [Leisingera sp. ANG-S]KID09083.1 hypothetical protein GC1_10355 [Leisingera sp. ANG1]
MEVGRALTKAFLAIVAALAILPQHTADGGWQLRAYALITSPPNEIGDTFAGVAGVLAFLWIIVTVWLQSQELAEQRKELSATRDELKLTREAHQKQVNILEKQASIYEIEQKDRAEKRAKDQFDQMLRALADLVGNEREWGEPWVPSTTRPHMLNLGTSVFNLKDPQSVDEAIKQAVSSSQHCHETLDGYFASQTPFSKSGKMDAYIACLAFVKDVMGLYDDLGPDQKLRFDFLGLTQLSENLRALLEMNIWLESEAT